MKPCHTTVALASVAGKMTQIKYYYCYNQNAIITVGVISLVVKNNVYIQIEVGNSYLWLDYIAVSIIIQVEKTIGRIIAKRK